MRNLGNTWVGVIAGDVSLGFTAIMFWRAPVLLAIWLAPAVITVVCGYAWIGWKAWRPPAPSPPAPRPRSWLNRLDEWLNPPIPAETLARFERMAEEEKAALERWRQKRRRPPRHRQRK